MIEYFFNMVNTFYEEANYHFFRLAYRDAIAEHMGLDMGNEWDRGSLLKTVAKSVGQTEKQQGQWMSGQVDPNPKWLIIYMNRLPKAVWINCNNKLTNPADPIRFAIARTLTYIRVFPPAEEDGQTSTPNSLHAPQENYLKECQCFLKKHPYYKPPYSLEGRVKRDLNQHSIDYVYERFRGILTVNTEEIGDIKRAIEAQAGSVKFPNDQGPWFWPSMIFKFSTLRVCPPSSKRKNEHSYLWDSGISQYFDWWR